MDIVGLGKRVQVFVDEGDSLNGRALYLSILERLQSEGAAGATVTRGIAGFGAHSRIHTARLADVVVPLPLTITWIDAPDRVERLLPRICEMVREGLITVEDVNVAKYSHRDLPSLRSSLTVADLMTHDVTAVGLRTPVAKIIDLLIDRDFRAVPVVDEDGRLAGIITNGDLVERGKLPARLELLAAMEPAYRRVAVAPTRARAKDVMSPNPVAVRPDAPIGRAAGEMLTRGLKRLPVIDSDDRVVGMISRVDLLRALGESYPAPVSVGPAPVASPVTVGQVMTPHPAVVREDARLAEVLDAVVSTPLNRAVVVGGDRRVQGVVSDADVLRRLGPGSRSGVLEALMHQGQIVPEEAADATAGEMMTRPAVTATPDVPIAEAARRMIEAKHKVLAIVDQHGVLLGIVDRAHLLAAARFAGEAT